MRKLAKFFSRAFAFFFNLLPWSTNVFCAKVLTFIWVDVLALRKDVVFANIDIAFPGTPDDIKLKWMRQSIFVLTRSFFDILRIPYLNKKWIDQNVVYHGLENIQKNKGCLFLSLHSGSGDLASAILSEKFISLSLITKRIKNPFFDELWFSLRTQSKVEFIDAHGKQNAFEILKALKAQRGVIFVLDQFMGKPYGISSEFFGKTTGTAYGLALFAQKTKAPVIPLYTFWQDDHKLHIYIGREIVISDVIGDNKEDLNQKITNRFNMALENIIRSMPDHWMWVHRRWKDFE